MSSKSAIFSARVIQVTWCGWGLSVFSSCHPSIFSSCHPSLFMSAGLAIFQLVSSKSFHVGGVCHFSARVIQVFSRGWAGFVNFQLVSSKCVLFRRHSTAPGRSPERSTGSVRLGLAQTPPSSKLSSEPARELDGRDSTYGPSGFFF